MRVIETTGGLARWESDGVAVLEDPALTLSGLLTEHGSLEALSWLPARDRVPVSTVDCARPSVGAVWGVGLNYRSKAAVTGRDLPRDPILYLAAPSAIEPGRTTVRLPESQTMELDYEAEIGVLIGSALYGASSKDVKDAIAGVTAVNDLTARDVMRRTDNPSLAKSFPGFKPLGASYATLDELRDPDRIRVRSWVNGVPRQDGTSADMVFPLWELVSRLSHFATLRPGDLVLTGTPAGTGQDRDDFLAPGDEVRVEVDNTLPLVTRIAHSSTPDLEAAGVAS